MAKKTSAIIGINFQFRTGKTCDALRVWVFKDGKYTSISAKVHPTLKKINKYLKDNNLKQCSAELNENFTQLRQKLEHELRSEFGLATYKAIERLDMQTKDFDFEQSLEKFYLSKKNMSKPVTYRNCIRDFWFPFFIKEKKCIHPSEFLDYRDEAILHLRAAKTMRDDELLSFHSYGGFCTALNQYMDFLYKTKAIGRDSVFSIWIELSQDEIRRGKKTRKTTTNTYDAEYEIFIKKRIDEVYKNNPTKKLKAYGFLFGIITGLRRGNVLGLKAEDLFPDDEIPHFRVSDNVVSGHSRGDKGVIVFEDSTKTTTQEDDEILLPLLQPSIAIAVEVAQYLKANYKPKERVCPGTPGTFYRVWLRICTECGIKFLNPRNWKHSYATIGAENLEEWYSGDPRLLQLCCLHSSYNMTEKYIKKKYSKSLKAWAPKK